MNSETEWALKHWGFELPPSVEQVLQENPETNVCLVDFQQLTQLNPALENRTIVGVVMTHTRHIRAEFVLCRLIIMLSRALQLFAIIRSM